MINFEIGTRIELTGGYDFDVLYLKNPPDSKRNGTIVSFIEGQNDALATVVKLDTKIWGQKILGDIVVLELRYREHSWTGNSIVHIELCDFIPENKSWKERRKGEWVEAAATLKIIKK